MRTWRHWRAIRFPPSTAVLACCALQVRALLWRLPAGASSRSALPMVTELPFEIAFQASARSSTVRCATFASPTSSAEDEPQARWRAMIGGAVVLWQLDELMAAWSTSSLSAPT